MQTVRVRFALKRVRLEFDGGQGLYERTIEPLLLQYAKRPRAADRPPPPVGHAVAEAGGLHGASLAPRYVPPSENFSLFQRQLGEARNGVESRIAAYAFFLWNYERKEEFNADEVAGCFRADGADVPPEAESIYRALAAQRILTPGGTEGTWRLTTKGKAHVRHHLLSA